MPDSSELDAAVVHVLQADATLASLLPDGVYMDEAPPGSTRFTLVGLMDSEDTGVFGGRAIEAATYFVMGVALSTTAANMKAAAARIDDLLSDPPGGLAVPGYAYMAIHRDEELPRIRKTKVDDVDASIRWWHRGGHYRLSCAR